MKKILSCFLVFILLFILIGCGGRKSPEDVIKTLGEKVDNLEKYEVTAVMEIQENDKTRVFDIEISYLKPNYYKVELTNRQNNNVQIILKNDEGVYILTPALNKSFKFQSDWPLNSSQSYLYQSLVKDVLNDKEPLVVDEEGNYVIETKTNYREVRNLTTQKIIIDSKTFLPKEVFVYDSDNTQKIHVVFEEFNTKVNLTPENFTVDNVLAEALAKLGEGYDVFSDREIMYPTFLPQEAALVDEEIIDTSDGKKAIMSFNGDINFTVVQDFIGLSEDLDTEYVNGEPVILSGTVGVITSTSIKWYDNGIEFYVVSQDMTEEELILVANSFMLSYEK